jgi:hypothetical protein
MLAALVQEIVAALAAEYCPDSQSEIHTDRPDVTNSSFVTEAVRCFPAMFPASRRSVPT